MPAPSLENTSPSSREIPRRYTGGDGGISVSSLTRVVCVNFGCLFGLNWCKCWLVVARMEAGRRQANVNKTKVKSQMSKTEAQGSGCDCRLIHCTRRVLSRDRCAAQKNRVTELIESMAETDFSL